MNHMLMTVTLECADGEAVGHVVIPFFKFPPSILVWGTRIFRLYQELTYREVSSYNIPLEAVR